MPPQIGGPVVIMPPLKSYSKPALPFKDQLELLKSRGLIVEDEDYALKALSNVSYYHLEGYWFCFYDKTIAEHKFLPDVKFSQIVNLYEFDNQLRTLVFDAISRIEVSFRTRFIYELAMAYGPFPIKKENFNFRAESAWAKSYQNLLKDIEQSKEDYIKHYKNTYAEELPPIWIMGELMTFGELSIWYDNYLTSPIRKRISLFYGLQPDVLTSWMRVFSLIRNICAHHGRLWNKPLPFVIIPPKQSSEQIFNNLFVPTGAANQDAKRIFNPLLAMQYMLRQIGFERESCSLLKGLEKLIEKYEITNTASMGISTDLKQIIRVLEN